MTTASKIKVKNGSTFQSLLDICYPVGSIYQSTKATNPGTFLGGTWRSLSDRFLIGAGAKAAGATGGEESHTLTVSEMPSHTHKWLVGSKERIAYGISGSAGSFVDGLALGTGSAISITSTGGGLRTTICRPTSPCTCGSAQHRGDSLCALRSGTGLRSRITARIRSARTSIAPSTRTPSGSARLGLSRSRATTSSPQGAPTSLVARTGATRTRLRSERCRATGMLILTMHTGAPLCRSMVPVSILRIVEALALALNTPEVRSRITTCRSQSRFLFGSGLNSEKHGEVIPHAA